ncbi:HAD family hydrolase [Methylopila sp. M107]|uniref:P-type ATPase n=1 Tax=Methylopila sp. M107 TaxID=1101190 RepID=UPI00037B8E3B|nr:HAD family hydrolase [Methylopila sp. M107]
MSKSSKLRIAPGADGVSIWSADLFAEPGAARLREFLARAFAVDEVQSVEVRRAAAFGRVRYGAAANPAGVWRKLGAALRGDDAAAEEKVAAALGDGRDPLAVDGLYLDHPTRWPIRVGRVGQTLSTWRIRPDGENQLRLTHPVLRHRRSFLFRLEEQLASIFGVEDFRARSFSSDVLVKFSPDALSPERLVRELEKAWPALIDGADEPPSHKRLVTTGSLLTLAAVSQFAVPALRPVAVGAVVVYSAPNVAAAIRQLKHGEVGLPAMYSLGLGLMLLSGLPLTGTIMASLMQLWPYLTHRTIVNRQRRLFSAHRKRPVWARVPGARGAEVEVHVDDLKPGDEVVVRRGEIVPVDGVASEGVAILSDNAALAPGELKDVGPGDAVFAGAILRDGELTIRVERAGDETAAAAIGAMLPHSVFRDLPSLHEAERVANRNARPALAIATLNLLTTRVPRFSQAVIRPDYVTAPRLSAQLTALHDLAEGLRRGLLLRRPGALDVLSEIDVFVLDDTAGLERRSLEVAKIAASETSTDEALAYAAAAIAGEASERGGALARFHAKRTTARTIEAHDLRRRAGAILFRDHEDRQIAIATQALLEKSGLTIPEKLRNPDGASDTPKPLFVVRDGRPIGVLTFRRQGEPQSRAVLAGLRADLPRARFVLTSSRSKAATRTAAAAAGVDFAFGDLDAGEKASLIRGLGRRALWVGDGSASASAAAIAASDVSVSVAGLPSARDDTADILLLRGGLAGLTELRSLALAHRARLAGDYRAVYAANLVGVAGAFLANFGSLQAGLLSNLGSGVVYANHVRRLNGLIARIEADRTRLDR